MSVVQATVLTFHPEDHSGSVVLDDGTAIGFSSDVFAASRLRLLRPGQRVRIHLSDQNEIDGLTIITLPDR